jgi:hypothetical protein
MYSCMCNSHILVIIFLPLWKRLGHHLGVCTFHRELIKLTQNIFVLFDYCRLSNISTVVWYLHRGLYFSSTVKNTGIVFNVCIVMNVSIC